MGQVRVVTICTMNICRSPAMATLLERELAEVDLTFAVSSCGTDAVAGVPRCELAQAFIGVSDASGAARLLADDQLETVELMLTADRSHRGHVVALQPSARPRVFTMIEAARLASWVVSDVGVIDFARRKAKGEDVTSELGDMRVMTNPLPADSIGRLRWLVTEMDAARGIAPFGENHFEYLRIDSIRADDLPDPHVVGFNLHEPVAAATAAAAATFAAAVRTVLDG